MLLTKLLWNKYTIAIQKQSAKKNVFLAVNENKYALKKLRNSRTYQFIFQAAANFIAIWIAYTLQMFVRYYSNWFSTPILPNLFDYILGGIFVEAYWMLILFVAGLYANWQIRSPFLEFWTIIKTAFWGSIFIVALLLYGAGSLRWLFLLHFVFIASSLIICRYTARRLQIILRRKKIIQIPVILIGDVRKIIPLYQQIMEQPNWGMKILGFVLHKEAEKNDFDILEKNGIDTKNILGTLANLETILQNHNPEEIILTTGMPKSKILFEIENICSNNNTRVLIQPNLYDHFTGQSKMLNIYGIPLIEVNSNIMEPYQMAIKRLFDIVFSLLVIIIGMPLWLLMAAVIKIESKGNVIYSQPRIGRNNKVFTIYKFRSMTQTVCADPDNPKWTKVGDPRVTKFGKIIRKTHLDEIPQFYNVLIGDMSVVGPRPEQPKFVEEFASQLPYYNRRHIIKPGITGWWQVKYKAHKLDLDEIKSRTKDDFYYIENLSIRFDFEIIFRTIWCVLRGHGQA